MPHENSSTESAIRQPPLNSTASTAAILAVLSVVFLPLAWLLGAAAVLTARRARVQIARTGERGDSLAAVSLAVGWVTVGLVTAIYAAVLLSAVF